MEQHILRRWVLATFGCLAFVGIAVVLSGNSNKVTEMTFEGIPLPFFQENNTSTLKGAVTYVATKTNGVQVFRVTFPSGTEETLNFDNIYLVSVPNNAALTNIPFATAISAVDNSANHAINYYGYKYTSNTAQLEIQNKQDQSFSVRFPGIFFASTDAFDDDIDPQPNGDGTPDLQAFTVGKNISFINAETSDNPKIGGGLFIVVVNETTGGKFSIAPSAVCGDSATVSPETCDDGGTTDNDGCSATCTIESGYACTTASPSVCSGVCGNSTRQNNETCDDGNLVSLDGCSSVCALETGYTCTTATPNICSLLCGNNMLDTGEACDNGSTNGDGCSTVCAVESGYTCTGNSGSPSTCSTTCGDGVMAGAEECDDGTGTNGNGQPGSVCTTECVLVPLPF